MDKKTVFDLIIIGGGAAGFFAAINLQEKYPQATILILEKTNALLAKVKLSGGGRCNLSHSCIDTKIFSEKYPRGQKELLQALDQFDPQDTLEWFEKRGIKLKTEEDGRIFPESNSSQSIIDCFLSHSSSIQIIRGQKISKIIKNDLFEVFLENGAVFSKNLLLATGDSQDGWNFAKALGHSIQKPLPSLFSLKIASFEYKDLSGIALSSVEVKIKNSPFIEKGALLITHFGFSGPVILNLTAYNAKNLAASNYKGDLVINWTTGQKEEKVFSHLQKIKNETPLTPIIAINPYNIPARLWKKLSSILKGRENLQLARLSNKELHILAGHLTGCQFHIDGKVPNKQEFVACGGITLKEINFKTMESKICKSLYFAGEILDIDGITGGYNLQNAWTTAYIAAANISKSFDKN